MTRAGKYLFLTGIIIFMLIVPMTGFCQGDPGCDPLDPTCPIDGGVSLLIAAGVGLAARRAHKNQKAKKDNSK